MPLDGPMLRALAADEAIGLAMMDRMDPNTGAFDHDSRRRHWHALLCTWNAALHAIDPAVVIFSIAPHIVFDWALYALCRLRGVRTLMFERTSLPGRLLLVERLEDGCLALKRAFQQQSSAGLHRTLSVDSRRHIDGLRAGGEKALPPNYRKKLADRGLLRVGGGQSRLGLLRLGAHEAQRLGYVLIRRQAAPANYLLREDGGGNLASPSARQWIAARWRGQLKKVRLKAMVNRLAQSPATGRPFVLLALHYQPERAIVPMAGAFCDQLLIADLLASCLPDGWDLVVKEHPWQLAEMGRGELGRSAGFYRRLTAIPNVRLAPESSDTTTLLDAASAVATATGSIGWQAVARGKPALVFGAAWYRGCPGTFAIDDLASCHAAMRAIAGGATPAVDAAETTMAAVEKISITGYLEPALEDVASVTEDEAVAAMSTALKRAIKSPEPVLAQ